MNKLATSFLTALSFCLLATLPVFSDDDDGLPTSAVALKGLRTVKLNVNITKDARQGLKSAGYNGSALASELQEIAKKKLSRAGLDFDSVGSDYQGTDSKLTILIDSDLATGQLKESLRLEELVSVVRSPATRVFLTTWSRSQSPRGNETPSIKTNTVDLLDQFEGDFLDTNGRVK